MVGVDEWVHHPPPMPSRGGEWKYTARDKTNKIKTGKEDKSLVVVVVWYYAPPKPPP